MEVEHKDENSHILVLEQKHLSIYSSTSYVRTTAAREFWV